MMTAFNFDLTNTAHANAFASIMAIASANGVPFEMVNGTSTTASAPETPTPSVSAPVKGKRDYEANPLPEAKDETLKLVTVPVKGKIAFRALKGEGSYGGKLMVKDAGFEWHPELADDKYHGAWVGTTAQGKKLGITSKSTEIVVPKAWVQAGRDKAAERKSK